MNGSPKRQPTELSISETFSGFSSMTGSMGGRECIIEPAGQGTVDIRLKRLQLYVNYLELLLLRKNNEMCELQRIMDLRVEEMRQKQAENERVMIHQARHAAMGEMLGTIAHQWRQPLHAISLVVQNIKDAREYGEFNDELLDRSIFQTMEQVMRLSRTIDDFRMFLNPAKTSEFFNPIKCIDECVGLLSGWFSDYPDIEVLHAEGAGANIRIAGCQDAFKQVILNLFNNASDIVKERQRKIGSSFRGLISINFRCRDDDAVIGIADNGGGIPESALEHIFEPYFTTKEKSNGIGIGLYVSRLIIENSMNGSLCAENITDGSLFEIRVPVAEIYEV